MILSPKQIESIRESTARINVWDGSVSSGKTVGSIYRWIHYTQTGPPGKLVMVGKTERTLRRNIINPLEEILGRRIHYNRGDGEIQIGKRLIHVVGANDERAEGKIRGSTYAGGYGDELTLWPEGFFKMLMSRFRVAGAQMFGTTNPDSPGHWLKKKYLDRIEHLNLKRFHFVLDDNPFLPDEYKRDLKAENTGLWYKRYILGQWVLAEGAIYDMIRDSHFLDVVPKVFSNFIVGVDYGTSNPCTFGLYGFNRTPPVYLLKEYWFDSAEAGYQKTDGQYANDMEDFLGNTKVDAIYVDPSAASFKLELQRRGRWTVKDANNDVLDGIRHVSTMLANGQYFMSKECTHTRENYEAYVWDSKAQSHGEDKPVKENDHACDRDRYAIFSHFAKKTALPTSFSRPTPLKSATIRRSYARF